jgi:hypothetical protein
LRSVDTLSRGRLGPVGFDGLPVGLSAGGGAVRTEDGAWTKAVRHQRFVLIVFGAQQRSEADQWLETLLKNIKGVEP